MAAVLFIHLAGFYVLIRALAPDAVSEIERATVAAFDIAVPPPPPPPSARPSPSPAGDEGAAGAPGRMAVSRAETAPPPPVPLRTNRPAPRASSTGAADRSGAVAAGEGTGRSGVGDGRGAGSDGAGTGSGSGGGAGGGIATPPKLVRDIRDARAFPVPPGGREARIGKSVDVLLSVSATGRVTSCAIHRPSPFPETDAIVCRLAVEQVRFEPARNVAGEPIASTFLYRQRFFN